MKIFPTITTTNFKWKEKIREADELGIIELAVFPTVLNKIQREELYDFLKHSKIKSIPFVHLRSDMGLDEIEFFIKKYNTQIFNVHSEKSYPIPKEWAKYSNIIAIENTHACYLDEKEIKKFGGICIDFAHLENDRITDLNKYYRNSELMSRLPIRCNHISAIKNKFKIEEDGDKLRYDSHVFENLSEFDYLKKYSYNYFSDYCALELENRIGEQLKVKDYILKLLQGRDEYVKKFFNE
ncbi:MAG: hypothetical protein PHI45_01300 [Candidatus Pacebacteria bacterium]|nr:hypothetical protein [Candidatus Paceibacterota bacterium]MDD5013345.1 hypothetical protein [Candidatus Paceibacterota bacterium]MDD5752707.1 hypothetical protein [Candidatus Paceibacterota bacterium]